MTRSSVTIVLASIDAEATIAESLSRFLDELRGRGRVIVADASRDRSLGIAASVSSTVEVVAARPGTLAPELWGLGLERVDTEFVAFSTAQMLPRAGWLDAMLATLQATSASGVGGPIAARPRLSAIDRALYLLRYASYLPPVPHSKTFQPPGDNAVYRRRDLLRVRGRSREGFWEVENHARLMKLGKTLAMSPEAVVDFAGGCRLGAALSHRLAHARRYGASRCEGLGVTRRAARAAIAPLVPALLLARIIANLRSRREPLGPWLGSFPYLGLLLGTWSIGEAIGAIAVGERPSPGRHGVPARSAAIEGRL